MVQLALEELDPASSPGIDGVPAALYQKLDEVFVPQIWEKICNLRSTPEWEDE